VLGNCWKEKGCWTGGGEKGRRSLVHHHHVDGCSVCFDSDRDDSIQIELQAHRRKRTFAKRRVNL
jgi:hypothetical protein